MKSLRKWLRDLFGFSGTEINGFVILIPLMILLVFSEPIYHRWVAREVERDGSADAVLDSILAAWEPGVQHPIVESATERFEFNPNTVSFEELRRLGMDEISAKRIAAYRMKGGVFRIKSDLMKIYGLDSTLYNQLYGYITLPTRILPVSGRERADGTRASTAWKRKEVNPAFDINTADTLQLKSVFGIGSRLAARIVKFRDALGGFVKPEQLFEVYGLDSLVVRELQRVSYIREDFEPQKINVNDADEKILSAHPYIRSKLARMLASYRFQHGDFMQVSDIKKLSAAKPEEMERLLPYLKVED